MNGLHLVDCGVQMSLLSLANCVKMALLGDIAADLFLGSYRWVDPS